MGCVYLAEHVRMGRKCAVKMISPTLARDAAAVARFNREAANASQINHPGRRSGLRFRRGAEPLLLPRDGVGRRRDHERADSA